MNVNYKDQLKFRQNLTLVLGTQISAYNNEIKNLTKGMLKKAYYQRAKETHPDRSRLVGVNSLLLEQRFSSLQNAYDYLENIWEKGNQKYFFNYYNNQKPPLNTKSNYKRSNHFTSNRSRTRQFKPSPIKINTKSRHTPYRKLRLAEFLYYQEKIDWETLISAISWQYINRPKIGAIALEKKYLTKDQILKILKNKDHEERFGQAAIRLGFLNESKLMVLAGNQRLLNLPIGKYFIKNKILTENEIDCSVKELKRHNLFVSCNK